MKKVGFIGACDKTNIIMCVAKILKYLDYKVLVVDATVLQRFRYIAPAIMPTKSYITSFEDIDFAVGFTDMLDIVRYLGVKEVTEEKMPYDYVLIDVDYSKGMENFDIENIETNYFVTTFDMFSLKRGIAILNNIKEPIQLTKVLCNYNIRKEDEEYLNYLSLDAKVIWKDLVIYVPINTIDNQILEENQKLQRIKIKRLGSEYQDSMYYIVQDIVKGKNIGTIRKSIKE